MVKAKRLSALLTAIIMCISAMGIIAYADTSVVLKSTTWDMSTHSTTSSNIEADFEWKNLSVVATSAKPVTFNGTYMVTQGAANVISFKVAGSCTITVTTKSNSTSTERYAVVRDSGSCGNEDNILATITASTSGDNTASAQYTGYGETITITPKGGGISIKSIAVEYTDTTEHNSKGDVNGDGSVDEQDAALVLRHIAGIDKISNNVALSAANGNNDGSIDVLDANWILNNVYEATSETTTEYETIDTSDGTEVTDYDGLTTALSKAGAIVYVMNDIDMEDRIQLSKGGQTIIGVPDEDGTLPVLNFENMTGSGADITSSSSGDGDVGIRIRSADNVIKNLIIEKAHDNGIQIKGTEATGNLVENCIVRYNNDSGIQVTGGACGNTLKSIYSYRNCDVYTLGGNADGFAIKLSAGPALTDDETVMEAYKNECIDCYAWENGDDGWDSFDYPVDEQSSDFQSAGGYWTYRNDYENCMCWSNGAPANCLGYTDYINYSELDESLPFMMRFKALYESEYNSFVTAYNNGTLCSRTASASTYYSKLDSIFGTIPTTSGDLSLSNIASSSYWQGNPNGFKLGSKYTQDNSERYMYNCIAFDHGANGFDRNNSAAEIWAENCMSFGNNINYHLSGYTAYKWTNVYGWSGSTSDNKPTAASGVTVSINDDSSYEETIRDAADRLVGYASANTFVSSNVFDTVF